MTSNSWSPESLGIPNRQNFLLWKDMEKAYDFIETHARYSISGSLEGFLFELIRRRWNLACADLYDSPPNLSEAYDSNFQNNLFPTVPAALTLSSVDKLRLNQNFARGFKQVSVALDTHNDQGSSGKLYGYGTDGYGTYIPLHLLWPQYKSYWGIYVSEIGVLRLAATFYHNLVSFQKYLFAEDETQQIGRLIQIAYQVILRHQLFHFKVEQWALLFELATGRAYYLPYLHHIYLPTVYDPNDNNLEEALSNLSILLSKKIQKIQKEGNFDVTDIIKRDFLNRQGPNYRNYELDRGIPSDIERFDREVRYREVVNLLCNQIIRHELRPQNPMVPYYIYPPNNNFLRAENLCPIYLVRNLPYQVEVIA